MCVRRRDTYPAWVFGLRWTVVVSHPSAQSWYRVLPKFGSTHSPRSFAVSLVASHFSASFFFANDLVRLRPVGSVYVAIQARAFRPSLAFGLRLRTWAIRVPSLPHLSSDLSYPWLDRLPEPHRAHPQRRVWGRELASAEPLGDGLAPRAEGRCDLGDPVEPCQRASPLLSSLITLKRDYGEGLCRVNLPGPC